MRRLSLALGATMLLVCASASAATTPDYFTFPTGNLVSNFGVAADSSGNIWFSVEARPAWVVWDRKARWMAESVGRSL